MWDRRSQEGARGGTAPEEAGSGASELSMSSTSWSPAAPGGRLGSYSVTTMSDSMGSGEGVWEWAPDGAGQLQSRSGRGWADCGGAAWLGSAEGQAVT